MLPEPTRRRTILKLALPIIAGMLSQSLLNLIDAALVGRLGEVALAGVGIGGYAMFLVTAMLFGLSSGVQAQTARRHGEQAWSQRATALNDPPSVNSACCSGGMASDLRLKPGAWRNGMVGLSTMTSQPSGPWRSATMRASGAVSATLRPL